MKVRASALLTSPGKYETIEVDLEGPRQGEVLIRVVAAGLCHSDDHIATGDLGVGKYPVVGGHEGAGVVEEVGPNTVGVVPGDHIIFSFMPVCGRCRWCATGRQNLCDLGALLLAGSRFDDPTSFRMSYQGQPVGQMCGTSTFAEYTTVDTRSIVVIDKDIPLETACLVGCGVITGWGSAVNAAQTGPGDVVIVMGVGGVGINAVQGALQSGAAEVIAVDPVAFKREFALSLGATSAFATIEEATDYAQAQTNGQGADSAIITTGVTTGEHIAQAFSSIRKAGTLVVAGFGNPTKVGVPIAGPELVLYQKRIQGAIFGMANPTSDIPRALQMYRDGSIKLDELISRRYTLDEVAQGYQDMHAGVNIRGIVTFSER
jgi:S-(hydroxymethyl)glutathione dehydrogenase/alcohol dehydrogenase